MTDREFDQLFVILDQVWGGVDEGREAGYRWVLADYAMEVVAEAVAGMSREDRTWLPRAPEIAARCERILRQRDAQRRLEQIRQRMIDRLEYEDKLAGLVERATGGEATP